MVMKRYGSGNASILLQRRFEAVQTVKIGQVSIVLNLFINLIPFVFRAETEQEAGAHIGRTWVHALLAPFQVEKGMKWWITGFLWTTFICCSVGTQAPLT